MTPRQVIRLPKVVVGEGEWKVVTGKAGMAKSAFPLAGRNGFVLGRKWHWRVDQLAARDMSLRLLTAYHDLQEEFLAWLSIPKGRDHAVVGRLEYHGTHGGWHCHIPSCDLSAVEGGQPQSRNYVRFPRADKRHRRVEFDVTEATALSRSFRFFRVTGTPRGALL